MISSVIPNKSRVVCTQEFLNRQAIMNALDDVEQKVDLYEHQQKSSNTNTNEKLLEGIYKEIKLATEVVKKFAKSEINIEQTAYQSLDESLMIACFDYAMLPLFTEFQRKQLLLDALGHIYIQLGLISGQSALYKYDSLADWANRVSSEVSQNYFEDILTTTATEVVLSKVSTYTPVQKYFIAECLRVFGSCCKRIEPYKQAPKQYLQLFEKVFVLAEHLLIELEEGECAYNALTELYFDNLPYIHSLKNPDDIQGFLLSFDKVLERDDSDNMWAQVFSQIGKCHPDLKESSQYLLKAVKLHEKMIAIYYENKESPPFDDLKRLATSKCNYGRSLILQGESLWDEAEKHMADACKFADESRFTHPTFGNYYLMHAELLLHLGRKEETLQQLNKALFNAKEHGELGEEVLKLVKSFQKDNNL